MNILKKLGALAGASALVGTGIVAVAGGVAFADVEPRLDAEYYTIGGTATLSIGNCEAGSELIVQTNHTPDLVETTVAESGVIEDITIQLDENVYGPLDVRVTCNTPEGSTEAPSEVDLDAYILNQTISANPSVFEAGEEISVTAGEFLAGETATMKVTPRGGGEVVYTQEMGTVAEDRGSVTAPVTFPADIECGLYDVTVSTVTNAATATLNICGQDDDDETPSPTPTPEPTVTPTADPTVAPTVTPTADPTVAPTQPTRPGLPKTGN